jgi:hypothetical protein
MSLISTGSISLDSTFNMGIKNEYDANLETVEKVALTFMRNFFLTFRTVGYKLFWINFLRFSNGF